MCDIVNGISTCGLVDRFWVAATVGLIPLNALDDVGIRIGIGQLHRNIHAVVANSRIGIVVEVVGQGAILVAHQVKIPVRVIFTQRPFNSHQVLRVHGAIIVARLQHPVHIHLHGDVGAVGADITVKLHRGAFVQYGGGIIVRTLAVLLVGKSGFLPLFDAVGGVDVVLCGSCQAGRLVQQDGERHHQLAAGDLVVLHSHGIGLVVKAGDGDLAVDDAYRDILSRQVTREVIAGLIKNDFAILVKSCLSVQHFNVVVLRGHYIAVFAFEVNLIAEIEVLRQGIRQDGGAVGVDLQGVDVLQNILEDDIQAFGIVRRIIIAAVLSPVTHIFIMTRQAETCGIWVVGGDRMHIAVHTSVIAVLAHRVISGVRALKNAHSVDSNAVFFQIMGLLNRVVGNSRIKAVVMIGLAVCEEDDHLLGVFPCVGTTQCCRCQLQAVIRRSRTGRLNCRKLILYIGNIGGKITDKLGVVVPPTTISIRVITNRVCLLSRKLHQRDLVIVFGSSNRGILTFYRLQEAVDGGL